MMDYILPLLPYNIKVYDTVSGKIFYATEFINDQYLPFYNEDGSKLFKSNFDQLMNDDSLKIILRPLSEINEDTEIDGDTFKPKDLLTRNLQSQMDIFNLPQILDLRVVDYQRLLTWNFDLFGLIELGRGININDIPTEL